MLTKENESIESFINDLMISSDAVRRESASLADGSWGAGYDQGYHDAVKDIGMKLQELWYPAT